MHNGRGQVVGYIRVSTLDQNIARQESTLKPYGVNQVFVDYASGKNTDREQLKAALKYLRDGDTFIVSSMDRLARNLFDLKNIVSQLTDRGIAVHFLKENLIFSNGGNAMAELLLGVLGAFAEFERSLIKERQREGIEIAKSKGLYRGRKRSLNNLQIQELKMRDKENQHRNRSELARRMGISRQTLYNYLRGSI